MKINIFALAWCIKPIQINVKYNHFDMIDVSA